MCMNSFLALKIERGYNQRSQWYQILPWDKPDLHAKFHQNRRASFGDISIIILVRPGYSADWPVYIVDQWSIAHLEGIWMQMNVVSDNFWYWPLLLSNAQKCPIIPLYQYNNFGKAWKGDRLAGRAGRWMGYSSFGSIFDADECSVGQFLISHFFT